VISVDLAEKLAQAGLRWEPARGDHFMLPHKDMDDDVFVLSDMTIEVHQFPAGEVLGFNGTVEWALDSVERHEALWLPREDQLRDQLGPSFLALTRTSDGYRCQTQTPSGVASHCADDPADAYALALLEALAARP
jgi:hypothetical protein